MLLFVTLYHPSEHNVAFSKYFNFSRLLHKFEEHAVDFANITFVLELNAAKYEGWIQPPDQSLVLVNGKYLYSN